MDPIQENELFERYLQDKCTPEERRRVETWYREQAAGRSMPSQTRDPLVQREQGWASILLRIGKIRRTRQLRTVAAIAAAILLFLFSGLFIYLSNPSGTGQIGSDDKETLTKSEEDISPGGKRAVLKLSDGRIIELDSLHSGIVSGPNGVQYTDGSQVWDGVMAAVEGPVGQKGIQDVVLSTPRGGNYEAILPDGSRVWLNAASSLVYPLTFSDEIREVELEGEAYFDITHNPSVPFVVKSNGQEIEVLGTEFNVSAYSDESVMRTTLVSGKIMVSDSQGTKRITLQPGEQAVVDGDHIVVNEVDVDQFIAWKDGLIIFRQADFHTLLKQIERWYDVTFEIQVAELPMTFSGEVPRNVNLSAILRVLELNTTLNFTINGRRIIMTD